ncbi:MAG: ferritin [Armatimonadota bacterium]
MLNPNLEKAINEHINKEVYSAYLYLAMSAYCDANRYPGAGHWMRAQSNEEWLHALKMMAFVNDRAGRVILEGITRPPVEWSSLADVFEKTYEHEVNVSAAINGLMTLAISEKDYATQAFLQWFVTEQVEEEKVALEIAEQCKMVAGSTGNTYMMDRHLGKRA